MDIENKTEKYEKALISIPSHCPAGLPCYLSLIFYVLFLQPNYIQFLIYISFVHNYSLLCNSEYTLLLRQCGGRGWSEIQAVIPEETDSKESEQKVKQVQPRIQSRCASSPKHCCPMSMSCCHKSICCFLK